MTRLRTSVAMATCEGARFIDEQLESIAAQSRPPDELVVRDDASGDDTVARLEAFAARARFPVRIERGAERVGATANFERATRACSGDVVLLADQDDVWRPDKIASLVGVLEDRPEVGLVLCNGDVVDAERRPLGYDLWEALFFDERDQARAERGEAPAVFARRVVAAGNTLAYRTRFAPLLHPFPDLPSTHDAWVAFMVSAVSACALVHRPLIEYRLHDANQIGLRRFGLRDQYAQARRQVASRAFAREAAFFELARDRLARAGDDFAASDATKAVIAEKIAHSRARDAMPGSLLARLPVVMRELASGRYRRYAYGLKSVAQDLLLR